MTILFATDLSEPPSVTRTIEQWTDRMDAELLVLHVVVPRRAGEWASAADPMTGLSGLSPYDPYDPTLEENLERAEEDAFHRFLTARFRRSVRAALRRGDPADAILDDADDHDADLIVLGKHRRGRLERLLLGSTAKEVLNHSARPTLFVPVEEDT